MVIRVPTAPVGRVTECLFLHNARSLGQGDMHLTADAIAPGFVDYSDTTPGLSRFPWFYDHEE